MADGKKMFGENDCSLVMKVPYFSYYVATEGRVLWLLEILSWECVALKLEFGDVPKEEQIDI